MSFFSFAKKHAYKNVKSLNTSNAFLHKNNSSNQTLASNKDNQSIKKQEDMQSKAAKPSTVHDVLNSPGQWLDVNARDTMESGFGHDFSKVRVHTNEKARESAREVGALAYTVGRDVVFGDRQYDPETYEGKHLLAHELTHVVQQERGGTSSQPDQHADAAADSILRGETVSPALLGGTLRSMQMKPGDPADKPTTETPKTAPGSWSTTLDKFAHNSAVLTDKHHKNIETLVDEIAMRVGTVAGARAKIMVDGNTDTSGDEKYNESLGLKRANAAKTMLETALSKKKVGADRIAEITTTSSGEKNLAVETADGVREPLNRRVIITVTIEGPSVSTSPPTSVPSPGVKPEREKEPSDNDRPSDNELPKRKWYDLPPDYKLPEESWWERTERERRFIEEVDRKYSRKPKSLTDLLVESVTKALEPIIRELPGSLRDMARKAIRKGIEAGTEKACETAIDASGVSGEKAEAMKAACKAALKTKPGSKRR